MHRWTLWFGRDADYMVYESLQGGRWTQHMRWMIPGTQIED